MKMLILTSRYLPEISAQSIRLNQMIKRFQQKSGDIRVRVVVFDPEQKNSRISSQVQGLEEVSRYKQHGLPSFAFMPQSLNPFLLAYWTFIARKEIREFEPDVVLATTPPFAPATALYLACKIGGRKLPYIIDYRDDLSSVINSMADKMPFHIRYALRSANKIMSSLLFRSIKGASLVSAVNEPLMTDLLIKNGRAILVPNGLDLGELAQVKASFDRSSVLARNGILNAHSKVVIYLGDLNMPYYLPEAVLEPLKKLREKSYDLIYIVIGGGKRRDFIDKKAQELGLKGWVYVLGKKAHKDALELLMASDVAFHTLQKGDPQARHAIATKVYEYLGCMLPILVVADSGSAVSELVNGKKVGVSVDWEKMERIELGLKEILDHPEIYKKNLETCYQYFLDKFDRNKGIDLLYKNLVELAAQRRD
jgi:glycosyltransferase involved in cell wall biosynthesis